jgi:hypothetical protein
MRNATIKHLPFHVFLLSIFPSLALLTNNLGQTDLWVVHRPLIVSILIGLLFFLVARLLARNWQAAGLWASLAVLMFFSYGHIYQIVEDTQIYGFLIGRHRYLIFFWGAVFIFGTWLIFRRIREESEITPILNLVSLILVLFQIGRIATYQIRKSISQQQAQAAISDTLLLPKDPEKFPDVYLIILDMYGREDAINANYGYDNSEFISQLEEIGFYVADCARSNYATTALSLASQLNMEYLDVLLDDVSVESTGYLIRNSRVRLAFEEIGYTSIAFNTGYGWANVGDSDIFFMEPLDPILWQIDPFELMFLDGSLVRPLLDYYVSLGLGKINYLNSVVEIKAQRTRMVLDYLDLIPQMPSPKFVHAHIMIPHPPHVFNIDGSVNLQANLLDEIIGFKIQLDYLNPRILEIVENIIDSSDPSPIIILEGDHGLFNFQRTSILNAIFLPYGDDEVFYPQISLVNTFRLLFNEYFGTDFPLLDDRSHNRLGNDDYAYDPNTHDDWNPACIP